MSRIGKYVYDINLEEMSIEKLQCLKSGCEYIIKQKQKDELEKAFTTLNLRAHSMGFDLCYKDIEMDIPAALNIYNFKVVERSET